jgi:hypothetical protein
MTEIVLERERTPGFWQFDRQEREARRRAGF